MTARGEFDRRTFLKGGLLGAAFVGTPLPKATSPFQTGIALEPVLPLPANLTRTWLGPAYWGNRLQDWQLANGRIECLRGRASYEVRTVAILTVAGPHPGRRPRRPRR
jgi:alkaline phosphatase D